MPVVTSLGAYPTFNFHVAGVGGRLVAVPYENDRESLDGLLAAVKRENAPLVYLSNPDNPMGTWWEAGEISRFIEALPETTMLVLDEAYGELGPALRAAADRRFAPQRAPHAHLLQGLRACRHTLRLCHRRGRASSATSKRSATTTASTAWRWSPAKPRSPTRPISREVKRKVAAGRERIANIARDNGLSPIPSATNFVTIDCGADGAFALKIMEALLQRDVFIRKPMVPVLNRCIRISVGLDHELDIFAEELPRAIEQARVQRIEGESST